MRIIHRARGSLRSAVCALALVAKPAPLPAAEPASVLDPLVAEGESLATPPEQVFGPSSSSLTPRLSFLPGGRKIATLGYDGGLQVLDLDQQTVFLAEDSGRKSNRIVFSADGLRAATALEREDVVRIWDVGDGRELAKFDGNWGGVDALAFAAKKPLLAAVSARTVRIWDTERATALGKIELEEPAEQIALGPEGDRFAVANAYKFRIIPIGGGAPPIVIELPRRGRVAQLDFAPDGQLLAVAADDRTIRLFSVLDGKEQRVLGGHEDAVRAAFFSPDGQLLVSDSVSSLRVWDVRAGTELSRLAYHYARAWAPDGRTLVMGELMGADLKLWDAKHGLLLGERDEPAWAPVALAASPAGQVLASVHQGGSVCFWDANQGRLLATVPPSKRAAAGAPPWTVSTRVALTASPDGYSFALSTSDEIQIWDGARGTLERKIDSDLKIISALAFSADGRTIAAVSDRALGFWDASTGQAGTLHRWTDPLRTGIKSLALSRDGKHIAFSVEPRQGEGQIVILDRLSGIELARLDPREDAERLPARLQESSVRSVEFSPKGRRLAAATNLGAVTWDTQTWRKLRRLVNKDVQDIAFSGDGRALATTSDDYHAMVWDPETGRELGVHGKIGVRSDPYGKPEQDTASFAMPRLDLEVTRSRRSFQVAYVQKNVLVSAATGVTLWSDPPGELRVSDAGWASLRGERLLRHDRGGFLWHRVSPSRLERVLPPRPATEPQLSLRLMGAPSPVRELRGKEGLGKLTVEVTNAPGAGLAYWLEIAAPASRVSVQGNRWDRLEPGAKALFELAVTTPSGALPERPGTQLEVTLEVRHAHGKGPRLPVQIDWHAPLIKFEAARVDTAGKAQLLTVPVSNAGNLAANDVELIGQLRQGAKLLEQRFALGSLAAQAHTKWALELPPELEPGAEFSLDVTAAAATWPTHRWHFEQLGLRFGTARRSNAASSDSASYVLAGSIAAALALGGALAWWRRGARHARV